MVRDDKGGNYGNRNNFNILKRVTERDIEERHTQEFGDNYAFCVPCLLEKQA